MLTCTVVGTANGQALELFAADGFFFGRPHNVYSIELDIQQISAEPL